MSRLVENFLESGVNVQLRHIDTETSWEDLVDHGYIATFDAAGKKLLRRDGFQHNRKLRNGGAFDEAAISDVVEETLKALPKEEALTEAVGSLKLDKEAKAGADADKEKAGAPGAAAA